MITDILACRRIFLALTTKCNARCEKCWRWEVYKRGEDIGEELLGRFFDLFSRYEGTVHVGTGENTISARLGTFVDWINRSRAHAVILTNGTNLTTLAPGCFTRQIKWGITLDGFFDADLVGFQYGIDLAVVKQNIAAVKREHPQAALYLNYTLTNQNIQNLARFVAFGIENGITELYITPLKGFVGFQEQTIIPLIPDLENPRTQRLVSEAVALAQRGAARINNPLEAAAPWRCGIDRVSPVIDIKGDVSFCYGREEVVVGSLLDDAFPEIFASWLREGKGGAICSECGAKQLTMRDKRGLYYRR